MSSLSPEEIRRADRRAALICVISVLVLLGSTVVGVLVGTGRLPFAP